MSTGDQESESPTEAEEEDENKAGSPWGPSTKRCSRCEHASPGHESWCENKIST
jgi:hypothetical protein